MYQTKVLMSTAASINRHANCAGTPAFRYRLAGFGRSGCRGHLGDMPHLAPGPGYALAVEVDGGAGNLKPIRIAVDLVPDQVGHGDFAVADGFAERPSGNRADMLFELRDRCAVERPVSGIVHAGRDLIDQHLRLATA